MTSPSFELRLEGESPRDLGEDLLAAMMLLRRGGKNGLVVRVTESPTGESRETNKNTSYELRFRKDSFDLRGSEPTTPSSLSSQAIPEGYYVVRVDTISSRTTFKEARTIPSDGLKGTDDERDPDAPAPRGRGRPARM